MNTLKANACPLKVVSVNKAKVTPAPESSAGKVLRFTHYLSVIHCDQNKKQTWHGLNASPLVA
jgi:hypothetical protein